VFASVLKKYFPVVRILMKKSVDSEQTLGFDSTDFDRSGKGRKTVQKFNIEFIDGKLTSLIRNNLFAQGLAALLMEDDITRNLLLQANYEFSFNTKFELRIKNIKKQEQHLKEEINTEQDSAPA
jgi:hypothetical protein